MIAAALEVFHQLGAAEVKIGEGPGHRRDTLDLADDARYRATVPKFDSLFTDLNRDDVSPVSDFANEPRFYFPEHRAGRRPHRFARQDEDAPLGRSDAFDEESFGIVPGSLYGWPKNKLHYIGIQESVVALSRKFRNTFAIVDGVIGMEGNGPIQGTPKPTGVLVMGRDLVAVDSTCCRIMGIDPEKVEYLRMAAGLGHVRGSRVQQRGETIESVRTNYALIDEYKGLRLA